VLQCLWNPRREAWHSGSGYAIRQLESDLLGVARHGAVGALAALADCVVAMAVVSSMGRRFFSGREGVSLLNLLMPSALRWCLRNLLVQVGARVVVVVGDAQCASLVSAQFAEVGARVVVGVAVAGVAVVGVAVVGVAVARVP
jgi:hypothetical protein